MFTDDELADWKDRLRPKGIRAVVAIPLGKQRALLARLEAAEKVIQECEVCDCCMKGNDFNESHNAWRKATGK